MPHGLDQIRLLAPSAIVLDLRLPGLGGIEFLRLLATDQRLRRTPVVVCSGASDLTRVYGSELATYFRNEHAGQWTPPGRTVRPIRFWSELL